MERHAKILVSNNPISSIIMHSKKPTAIRLAEISVQQRKIRNRARKVARFKLMLSKKEYMQMLNSVRLLPEPELQSAEQRELASMWEQYKDYYFTALRSETIKVLTREASSQLIKERGTGLVGVNADDVSRKLKDVAREYGYEDITELSGK